MGVFSNDEMVEQEGFGGPHAPVLRSVTHRWSKASPGAYSSYRRINMTYFIYLCT
jgi:hypothetical protein